MRWVLVWKQTKCRLIPIHKKIKREEASVLQRLRLDTKIMPQYGAIGVVMEIYFCMGTM